MNEKHYTILYAVVSFAIVYLASILGFPPLRIFSSSMQSVALWLVTMVGLVYFLNGVGYDVHKEIAIEHNTGMALLVGLYGIAIAIVIHG
jgi:hypothetical protein